MATYYVEVVRVPFSGRRQCVKVDFNVHKDADFSSDVLSPGMTAVFRVRYVGSATEAVSCVMETAAGFSPDVQLVFGGRKKEQAPVGWDSVTA